MGESDLSTPIPGKYLSNPKYFRGTFKEETHKELKTSPLENKDLGVNNPSIGPYTRGKFPKFGNKTTLDK